MFTKSRLMTVAAAVVATVLINQWGQKAAAKDPKSFAAKIWGA